MKILAFAASNSQQSINKQLVEYAASLIKDCEVEILDLNDYEMPIFGVDRQNEVGIPEAAKIFFDKIRIADAVLISFAEHNGSYSSAFKNIYDWMSRIDMKVYQNKSVIMLATSPGQRGGIGVLQTAMATAPFFGADIIGSLSVPQFFKNFKDGKLIDMDLDTQLRETLQKISGNKT